MLGLIVQKITGGSLTDAYTERIWKNIGAERSATWNVDKVGGHEKAFCCFNATARDYARVGHALITAQGEKNPNAITSQAWLKRLSTPVVTLDYGWGYGAQMWHPYPGINLMMGLHGQYIYQDKANKTVIVKLSDLPTSADGIAPKIVDVLKQIAEKNY
jgi:CubicO group peptidase (beta-lactamase class C family)